MEEMHPGDGAIAVVVVDVQGDFTEARNGSLAVPGTGNDYIQAAESALRRLADEGFLTVGTQDWHPRDHISFYSTHPGKSPGDIISIDGRTQVLWPPHCVQETENARIAVDNSFFRVFIRKGANPGFDSYSAFRDDGGKETELDQVLKRNKVQKLVVFGLATDYCVKYTVVDGLRKGYRIIVIEDLCRGITPGGAASALEEMRREGAVTMKTLDIAGIRNL